MENEATSLLMVECLERAWGAPSYQSRREQPYVRLGALLEQSLR